MEVLYITETEDHYAVREALRRTEAQRVLLVLTWEAGRVWDRPLSYEVVLRAAQERGVEVAIVVFDPARRPLAREAGFPVFRSVEAAQRYVARYGRFPTARPPTVPPRPRRPLWAEEPMPPRVPRRVPLWLLAAEVVAFLVIVVMVGGAMAVVWPTAHIRLVPAGVIYQRIVPVSVDPTLEEVDLPRGVVPSWRIGDEFEAYAEVPTTGKGLAFSGRARGVVLFTNLLGQDYRVPAGTVVRTTAGSYPVRYRTTEEVVVPAFGQKEAPVEALEEGPRGNVDAYQINMVEGVAGFALRVTNPYPIAGAESRVVAVVSEEDRERAWRLAAQRVVELAYEALQGEEYLEPGEFLPRQTLVVQSVPKAAYTHLVGEQAETVGVTLRLLVTAYKVRARDVQAVAYRQLAARVPPGYRLTDARFEYGESAEEDVGPGVFTFFVTAYGYASAEVDAEAVVEAVRGKPVREVVDVLMEAFPLAREPEIVVHPEGIPYLPFLPVRIEVEVVPGRMPG